MGMLADQPQMSFLLPDKLQENWAGPQELESVITKLNTLTPWQWPTKPVLFITDLHADAQALTDSLSEVGVYHHNQITELGRHIQLIIGGDCLDKGPSNLELLDRIKTLKDQGATLHLLAGNHDMRLLMGLRSLRLRRIQPNDPGNQHLFVRMGHKAIPLFQEVYQRFRPSVAALLETTPSEADCRSQLYPPDSWFETFPNYAQAFLNPHAIEKEVRRMKEKVASFAADCQALGMTLREVYAAARFCDQLFLESGGTYAWFFQDMQLLHREGSFLFLHAGLDDEMVELITQHSPAYVNTLFTETTRSDLFEFYYGTLANSMRTKYRIQDRPLTEAGVSALNHAGVYAIVHGHRSNVDGQQLRVRHGLLHIESDITLNQNCRQKSNIATPGSGATLILPEGKILGISQDYPAIKVFTPH